MLATTNTQAVVIAISAGAVPIFLALLGAMLKAGRLEQKVDNLQQQILTQNEAQTRVLEGLVDRLDQLGQRFTEHAVQDATHFGELRGMLAGQGVIPPGK